MAEEQNNPVFSFKSLPLMGEPKKIKLDCAEPVKTGTNKFGEWNMWFGFVENATVEEGRRPNQTTKEGYSGKVIFFPSAVLNKDLIEAANGKLEVEVSVQKTAEETPRGLVTKYKVTKLTEGKTPQGSLTPGEVKLINDVQGLIKDGGSVDFNQFVEASKDTDDYGHLTENRVKELWNLVGKSD